MDAAEAWLREHDPDYTQARQAWRDLDEEGAYQTPPREIPWGTATDVARLLDTGAARAVQPASARHCAHCDAPFIAQVAWHRYCTRTCWQAANPDDRNRDRADYMRDYMRTYRAKRKDTTHQRDAA